MAEFSDPAWWPKPPPRPPNPVTLASFVFRGLAPFVLVAAALVLLVGRHGGSSANTRSVASFERCLRSHAAEGPGQARHDCQALLPAGSAVASSGPGGGVQQRFDTCLRNATANLPHGGFGGGQPGRGPSPVFRAAIAVCQSLTDGGGGSAGATPTATPSAGTPPTA